MKTVAQLKQLHTQTHTHVHTLRLIMICIDHDDVLPTYERQLPSCPPTHKVNLQTDTGCALRGAGDSLSVLARRVDTLAIHAIHAIWGNLFIASIHALFTFAGYTLGESAIRSNLATCVACVCVGNLHLLLVNTCK